MSSKDAIWSGVEELPNGETTILEASAGTGKTFQIAHLVTRLVAEYGVPLEKLLVITFTNAAVSELRNRIRNRIVEAIQVLKSENPPQDLLWDALRDQSATSDEVELEATSNAVKISRLKVALTNFDVAPISTIHGFCQKTLTQMAFESGQSANLELMTDTEEILSELVDDAFANEIAQSTPEEASVLTDMLWHQKSIKTVLLCMTKAVEPVIEPQITDDVNHSPLEQVRLWLSLTNELKDWFGSEEASDVIEYLRVQIGMKSKLREFKATPGWIKPGTGNIDKTIQWLTEGGLFSSKIRKTVEKLRITKAETLWNGDDISLCPAYPLFHRIEELLTYQDDHWISPLVNFAMDARSTFHNVLDERSLLTYETMLSKLKEVVELHPDGQLVSNLRGKYDVALVDEFQDTDEAQWSILKTVFQHQSKRLLLVGDPKQAIYSFRGADVFVYIAAVQSAQRMYSMDTNWRTDGPLVSAMNHFWHAGSQAFHLDDQVDYVNVGVPSGHQQSRIRNLPSAGDQSRRPLEIRLVEGIGIGLESISIPTKEKGTQAIVDLVGLETLKLLNSDTQILKSIDEKPDEWCKIQPNDIAILVNTNAQARLIQNTLNRFKIPSLISGQTSVLSSPVVQWLLVWLNTLSKPRDEGAARTLASTPLFSWSDVELTQVASGVEEPALQKDWQRWRSSIMEWTERFSKEGFARVFDSVINEYGVIVRLLATNNGERLATDLRHIVELIHKHERTFRLSPSGLAQWLKKSSESKASNSQDAHSIRLETEKHTVKIVTVHTSKGLEYPIVLLPFSWATKKVKANDDPLLWHEPINNQIVADFHRKNHPRKVEVRGYKELESRQEEMRLLYVALTRAKHHVVCWMGAIGRDGQSFDSFGLGRLSVRMRDPNGVPLVEANLPKFSKDVEDSEVASEIYSRLDALCETSSLGEHQYAETIGWSLDSLLNIGDLGVFKPTKKIEPAVQSPTWMYKYVLYYKSTFTSFSTMIKKQPKSSLDHMNMDPLVLKSAEYTVDKTNKVTALPKLNPQNLESLVEKIPSYKMEGGPIVGTWIHSVFENISFDYPSEEPSAELLEVLDQFADHHAIPKGVQRELGAELINSSLSTSLQTAGSGLPSGYSLKSLSQVNRLDEMEFDLGIGTKNAQEKSSPSGCINLSGLRLALQSRLSDSSWMGRNWLIDVLDNHLSIWLDKFSGILNGLIDVVFRTEEGVYFIVDYKTNHIKGTQEFSTLGNYTKPWLETEMSGHHYHLQSLIYTIAVHRLLQVRIPNYDYATHFGGHYYLFVRGMIGAETPVVNEQPLGVYFDRWPHEVVAGVDYSLKGFPDEAIEQIIHSNEGGLF